MKVIVQSPERVVFETEAAEQVALPGKGGEMVVLPDHTPLLTSLAIGLMEVRGDGPPETLTLSGGFAEITPEQVRVLADSAEMSDEIDVDRARDARQRAEERLKEAQRKAAEIDRDRARLALLRAINRLRAVDPSGR